MKSPRRGPSKRAAPATLGSSTRLDPQIKEAIVRIVRLLAHCGITTGGIEREVSRACRQVPKSWAEKGNDTLPYLQHASHILTLWFSDPKFLSPDGTPRPLPVQGKGDTIETLVQQVDSRLNARQVVRFLARSKVLGRVGERYVPRERTVVLRGRDVADSFRKLRGLLGMLRAFEHNQRSKREVPGWFEAFAENPHFPVRAIPGFDQKLRAHANKLLVQFDGDMHREERSRDPDEPTVRMAVGVYRFEELPPGPAKPRGRSRRRNSKRSR